MSLLAVTVIGGDRPGIIAAVSDVLAELGGNLEDSSMTILRGHFAMTLIVSTDATADEVQDALVPATHELGLVASVAAVEEEPSPTALGTSYVLSVHGADRSGIVAEVMRVIAAYGANVTDLTTRLAGDLYVLVADVDVPPSADVDALRAELAETAAGLGVEVTLRAADADLL